MPVGTYVWQGSFSRYLSALDYEHVTIGAGETKGFDTAKVAVAEFGFVQFLNGPLRAIWTPDANTLVSDTEGVIFFHAATTTFNRLEMLYFAATLNTGATSGDLIIHYYAPPTP